MIDRDIVVIECWWTRDKTSNTRKLLPRGLQGLGRPINRMTVAGATTLQRELLGFGRHRRRDAPRCKDAVRGWAARAQKFRRTAFRAHS